MIILRRNVSGRINIVLLVREDGREERKKANGEKLRLDI